MQIKVQPRIQTETWSLYWKESTKTETKCLATVVLEVVDAGSSTVGALMDQLAAHLNWPPEDGLIRLEGFHGPWQRALCRGRQLAADATLAAAGITEGSAVTVVRVELKAEGWKIQDDYALSDSEEEDE